MKAVTGLLLCIAAGTLCAAEPNAVSPPPIAPLIQCGVTTETHSPTATVTMDTLERGVMVELELQRDASALVRIHRSLLEWLLDGVEADVDGDGYLHLTGRRLLPGTDPVVGRFQESARHRHGTQQLQDIPEYVGYESHLGPGTNAEGPSSALRVRIVLDRRRSDRHPLASTLHSAALVVSSAGTATGARDEEFYRFPPLGRPFRTLACVSTLGPGTST